MSKKSAFYLKSGNKPTFKEMASSPLRTHESDKDGNRIPHDKDYISGEKTDPSSYKYDLMSDQYQHNRFKQKEYAERQKSEFWDEKIAERMDRPWYKKMFDQGGWSPAMHPDYDEAKKEWEK